MATINNIGDIDSDILYDMAHSVLVHIYTDGEFSKKVGSPNILNVTAELAREHDIHFTGSDMKIISKACGDVYESQKELSRIAG